MKKTPMPPDSAVLGGSAFVEDVQSDAAAPRVFAFAKALGLTVDHMAALLESYDLHLLSGPAMRDEIDAEKLRSALQAARRFIVAHPAVHGEWPILVDFIDSALGRATSGQPPTTDDHHKGLDSTPCLVVWIGDPPAHNPHDGGTE